MDNKLQDSIILKILNGVQAGVDVSLVDGDYVLGSGDDVDIQIFDASLSPHHARITVRNRTASIAALSGVLQLRNGITVKPGDDVRELYPLDLVTAGTTRFAVGPATADWASLSNKDNLAPDVAALLRVPWLELWRSKRNTMIGAGAALLLLGFWIFPHSMLRLTALGGNLATNQEQMLAEAIQAVDLAGHLKVRRGKDGTLHVEGIVDDAQDRQAAINAIKNAGITAQTHIVTLEALSDDVITMMGEHASNVTVAAASNGDITLKGTLPDKRSVERLLGLVRELAGETIIVRSDIQTPTDILREVTALASRTTIAPLVQLRLGDGVLEADGAIPLDMLDSWAGFLQAYLGRFADVMPLRSYVRLQNADGIATPVVAGAALHLGDGGPAGIHINTQRLRDGTYTAADILIGGDAAPPRGEGNAPGPGAKPRRSTPFPTAAPPSRHIDLDKLLTSMSAAPARESSNGLASSAYQAIELWEAGQLAAMEDGAVLGSAIDTLNQATGFSAATAADYKQVLARTQQAPARACWLGSGLNLRNVAGVLFWLDIFSRNTTLSIIDLAVGARATLMEAAFNPSHTAKCADIAADGSLRSYFLESISKQPHMVRSLMRDVPMFPTRITGLSLPGTRYFQSHDGQIYRQGELMDANISVLSIGELGIVFSNGHDLSIALVSGELAWETN